MRVCRAWILLWVCVALSSGCSGTAEDTALLCEMGDLEWIARKGWEDRDRFGDFFGGDVRTVGRFPLALNHIFRPEAGDGEVEYALAATFELNADDLDGLRPAILIPGIGSAWQLYLNGRLIRDELPLHPDGSLRAHRTLQHVFTPLNREDLRTGTNVVVFRLRGDRPALSFLPNRVPGFFFQSGYFLGDADALKRDLSEYGLVAMLSVYLLFGLYHLTLFRFRQSEGYLLMYGTFCVLVFVYMFTRLSAVLESFPDTRPLNRLEYMALMFLPGTFTAFFHMYWGVPLPRWLKWSVYFCAALALIVAVGPIVLLQFVETCFRFVALAMALHWPIFMYRRIREGRPHVYQTAAATALFFAAVMFDLVNPLIGYVTIPPLFPYGFFVFTIYMGVLLAVRFENLYRDSDRLNRELDEKNRAVERTAQEMRALNRDLENIIEERTEELKRSYGRLNELALSEERARISAELHDNMGGHLVDTSMLLARLSPGETLQGELLIELRRQMQYAIRSFREGLSRVQDVSLLNQDFTDGLALILLRRYSNADRQLRYEADDGVREVLSRPESEDIRRILLAVSREIATNDLKYGEDLSRWDLKLESGDDGQMVVLSVRSRTVYDERIRNTAGDGEGMGSRTIQERVSSAGGTVEWCLVQPSTALGAEHLTYFELNLRLPVSRPAS